MPMTRLRGRQQTQMGHEDDRCTLSVAPVRFVHADMSMGETPTLWSHTCPKQCLHTDHIVKWF